LSKKETRALISGIKKFGDIENRIGEIAPQIGLESKDLKVRLLALYLLLYFSLLIYYQKLSQTASELIKACRSAIEIAHESEGFYQFNNKTEIEENSHLSFFFFFLIQRVTDL